MRTINYSGFFKTIPNNYFRLLYNNIYGPQESYFWELHHRKSAMVTSYVGRIRPLDKYIKGPDNDSEDSLVRLILINYNIKESYITREHLSEIYGVDILDSDILLPTY